MSNRILSITPGLTRGGAETQMVKVARYLKSQGKSVRILALKPLNDFHDVDFQAEGIKVMFLSNWKSRFLPNTLTLFREVGRYRPNVVVAFMFIAIVFARVLKLRYRFQLISSVRSSVISRKWQKLLRLTARLDDLIVYNSNASKINFETQSAAKRNGIIINNAVAIPAVEPADPDGNGERPFVWVTVAHFRPAKDYRTLFRAIALLKDENVRLDCIGHIREEWPYEMLRELGIEDKVRILGFQSNPGEYLKASDGFVLSTFGEGSPNSMLEAMSYYKPVVASAVDGIEEFLRDAGCGFLARGMDPEDMASQMRYVMRLSPEERRKIGRKGRRYVENNFSEEQVLEKWLQVVC